MRQWPFKIAIAGGRLQGTEAVYLAKKAGFKSILIDKDNKAPASGLCDEFYTFDVLKKEPGLIEVLKKADFILPALENDEALAALFEIACEHGLKLAFDKDAYTVTSSKIKSDKIIKENNIPAPRYYPLCEGPYIVKPSGESGSAGVFFAATDIDVRRFLEGKSDAENWIAQEYLAGPSYSIEIIGKPGMYRTYEITEIHMADDYDCKMVTAPCGLSAAKEKEFSGIAEKLAEIIGLCGIMDVEVIDHSGALKVLEIDARIPSQTPMAVYHCTGVNLLSELAELTVSGKLPAEKPKGRRYTAIEHYLVDETGVYNKGEHIMGEGGPLFYSENFFGADEAVTDYEDGKYPWRGTFINSGETMGELEEKRLSMLKKLDGAGSR